MATNPERTDTGVGGRHHVHGIVPGRERARCPGKMCLRLFGRLAFNRSAPCNGTMCGCLLCSAPGHGRLRWLARASRWELQRLSRDDAGQQHLGCGGQMRSVFLGRFPFDRSLPGHGRLRCGCRSTVQHPGACGCALLSQAESRNMFIPPGSEPRGCFGGCRSHRSTTRAW